MYFPMQRKSFTLIEMLIVIVIIWILAAALVPRLQSIQWRARDTKRETDLSQIYSALTIYYSDHWALKTTWSYGEANGGAIDRSSISGFITFLVTAGILSSAPVDPINNRVNLSTMTFTGGYSYRYYCYTIPPYWLMLGYRTEDWTRINKTSTWYVIDGFITNCE